MTILVQRMKTALMVMDFVMNLELAKVSMYLMQISGTAAVGNLLCMKNGGHGFQISQWFNIRKFE